MFAWAPLIAFTDWATTDTDWRLIRRQTPSPLGLSALDFFKGEIGNGETTANNVGPSLVQYGANPGKPWCGAVCSWSIVQAAKARGIVSPVPKTLGARRLLQRVVAAGWLVADGDQQPGDVVAWARGQKAWLGHVGMVSRVEGGRWWYVAGNEGRWPAKVREHEGTDKPRRIGFGRLP